MMSAWGAVILLNGASSAGKTTVARALQQQLDVPLWHLSIDHLRESGAWPMARIRAGEFDWHGTRETFFEGFHRAIPAIAAAGNHLVVEHIVETEAWLDRLLTLLDGLDVFFVGVHCPLAELERRERARGDRPIGDARRDFESVHSFVVYDLELDGTVSVERNVRSLVDAWRRRDRPGAFDRMRAARPASVVPQAAETLP
jgi:chloramphenicol 3-O phosphotransferase